MVYNSYHDCGVDCKRLVTYVRIKGKWTKVGHYGTDCHQFEPFDSIQEEEQRQSNLRIGQLLQQVNDTKRQAKQEINQIKEHLSKANLFGVNLKLFCSLYDK